MHTIITGARSLLIATLMVALAGCISAPRSPVSEEEWKALEVTATATTDKSRVALDTALNALGNAMAEVDTMRKALVDDLFQSRPEKAAETASALTDAWKGEQRVLARVQDTSEALAICTNAAAQVAAFRLDAAETGDVTQQGALYRQAGAASREARKAADSAAAIAEGLKQEWLVPVPPPVKD